MMRQLEKLKKLESHNFLSIYECYIIYKFNLRQIKFFFRVFKNKCFDFFINDIG